jgi:hypothetical protein
MKAAMDQGDKGLAFNGQGGAGYSRGNGQKYSGNQSGQTMKENYGRGPTKGNHDTRTAGPVGSMNKSYNADSINMGRGPTNPGSTRAWDPKATQNYRGNSDMINVGRGPRKGNQE